MYKFLFCKVHFTYTSCHLHLVYMCKFDSNIYRSSAGYNSMYCIKDIYRDILLSRIFKLTVQNISFPPTLQNHGVQFLFVQIWRLSMLETGCPIRLGHSSSKHCKQQSPWPVCDYLITCYLHTLQSITNTEFSMK